MPKPKTIKKTTGDLTVEQWPIDRLRPYPNNPRIPDRAIAAVAESIRRFGWRQPIVADGDGTIVCGHVRYLAARRLAMVHVPVHVARDLSAAQVRAYRVADNKVAELAQWEADLVIAEVGAAGEEFDWSLLGLGGEAGDDLAAGEPTAIEQLSTRQPPALAWVVVAIPTVEYARIAAAVEQIAAEPGVFLETTVTSTKRQARR